MHDEELIFAYQKYDIFDRTVTVTSIIQLDLNLMIQN